MDIPLIISVDDHVVEPPDLWTDRDPGEVPGPRPRVERDSAIFHFEGGVFSYEKGVDGGEPCDWWLYDDLVYPFPKLSAAVGFPELDVTPDHVRRDPPRLLEASPSASPTWTPTTSRRRSASRTRCPASAARRSSSATTRSSRSSA